MPRFSGSRDARRYSSTMAANLARRVLLEPALALVSALVPVLVEALELVLGSALALGLLRVSEWALVLNSPLELMHHRPQA